MGGEGGGRHSEEGTCLAPPTNSWSRSLSGTCRLNSLLVPVLYLRPVCVGSPVFSSFYKKGPAGATMERALVPPNSQTRLSVMRVAPAKQNQGKHTWVG